MRGINEPIRESTLVEQLVDSIRRVEFVERLPHLRLSAKRAEPGSRIFNPLKGAVIQAREGFYDEACWLVFLAVHCGWNRQSGWLLVRDIYGALGSSAYWTWERTSKDPSAFRHWLAIHEEDIREQTPPRRFGNHRKYTSLDAESDRQTGAAVATYVKWIMEAGSHRAHFAQAFSQAGNDPERGFDCLYKGMDQVASFGRMAKFDYLTMLRKLNLANVTAGRLFLPGATGPVPGAKLLFGSARGGPTRPRELERCAVELAKWIGVDMQVMEDALCNWQKNPNKIVHYRV